MNTPKTIRDLFSESFTGEWGAQADGESGNAVLRSTNFGGEGHLDLSDVVRRKIEPSILAKKKLRRGDTLLEKSGGGPEQPVGRVVYFDHPIEAVCSNFIQACRPKVENDAQFVFYLLDHFYRAGVTLQFQQQTTGLMNLKLADFFQVKVFPPSKNHQTAIAEILAMVDRAIEQTEALLAKQQRIKSGLTHDLLTRGLDAKGELRDPAKHKFKKSPLGQIPIEWDLIRVENAGEVTLGRQRSPIHEKGNHIRPYLRVANVFDGWIDYSDVLQMNFTPTEQETFGLQPGDILLNEGQSLELVGRSAIFDGPPKTFCFQNTLVRFRCKETTIPSFCQAVFKYWLDLGSFQLVAKQTTSVAHLGADRFSKMPFACPKKPEQEQIAEKLAAQSSSMAETANQISKLRRVKTGLMDDLLTGRVPVTPLLAAKKN